MVRSFLWITALVVSAGLAVQPSSAAAAARTWDLVTYTAPEGFEVVEKKEGYGVELTKASATSLCTVSIYSSIPTSSDLASFAALWEIFLVKAIIVLDAGARLLPMLVLTSTPTEDEFEACQAPRSRGC